MAATWDTLRRCLLDMDGDGYRAYRRLRQESFAHDFGAIFFDHIQSDPYAPPSQVRVVVDDTTYPPALYGDRTRRVAVEDFIARAAAACCERIGRGIEGTGNSGHVGIDAGGQEVLERTAVHLSPQSVELRLVVGLPARGRRVAGGDAATLLCDRLPALAEGVRFARLNEDALQRHVAVVEDQCQMRRQLSRRRLVAFLANGAILPRLSGTSDEPLPRDQATELRAPDSLTAQINAPNAGVLLGLGIPEGVTVIVGGGYHGKSTLLRALQTGIYDHIPGDGRERVVAVESAVKIRAEDGRSVHDIDLSPFIHSLPGGQSTLRFSTENASGSTSQAASIVEALEAGARVLLMDEDTTASNLMTRDARMQELVSTTREPITPLVDHLRPLHRRYGVSTILVTGSSSDFLEVADTVVMMHEYHPQDVTRRAQMIVEARPSRRHSELARLPLPGCGRRLKPESIQPRHRGRLRVTSHGTDRLVVGNCSVDLRGLEQLIDPSQARAIAAAIYHLGQQEGGDDFAHQLAALATVIEQRGLDALALPHRPRPPNLARPRMLEVAQVLHRMTDARFEPVAVTQQ